MENFTVVNDIIYTFLPERGVYYVGSANSSMPNHGNNDVAYERIAVHTATNLTSLKDIIIPEKVNGFSVVEIGYAAFAKLEALETVQIDARIVQINQFAFYGCSSLMSINIPPTVKFIGFASISALKFNASGTSLREQYTTSTGVLTVKFEPNSTITTIQKYGIERKEHVIIYYCGYVEPDILPGSLFFGATSKIVFSPIPLNWSEVRTEPDPAVCTIMHESIIYRKQPKNTCIYRPVPLFLYVMFISMIFSN